MNRLNGAILGVCFMLLFASPTHTAMFKQNIPEETHVHVKTARKVVMPGYAIRTESDSYSESSSSSDLADPARAPLPVDTLSPQLSSVSWATRSTLASRAKRGWIGDKGVKIQGRWHPKKCHCRLASAKPGACYVFTEMPLCESRYCPHHYVCVRPGRAQKTCDLHRVKKEIVPVGAYHCKQQAVDDFIYVPSEK